MTPEQNEAVVRQNFELFWNDGDGDLIDQLYDPEHILHDPSYHLELLGWDGVRKCMEIYRAAFPNTRFSVDELVAQEDRVAVRWTVRGTHLGDLFAVSATGRQVVVSGMSFFRLRNGRLAETWISWDTLGLLHQIGLLPEPRTALLS